ncbi:hypothetical protein KI387_040653, partial [Taxus chinensis]
GMDVKTLVVISGRDCRMKRTRFWKGVWATNTKGGWDAKGTWEADDVGIPTLRAVDDDMVDVKGATNVEGTIVII